MTININVIISIYKYNKILTSVKMSQQLKFVKSNHGKHDQIVLGNNIYWYNQKYKNGTHYYFCQNRRRMGCNGNLTISPNKTNIIKQTRHGCIGIAHETIKIIEAKQELKEKLRDPALTVITTQSLYHVMENNLIASSNTTVPVSL